MASFKFVIHVDDDGAGLGEIAMQGLAAMEAAIAINIMHFERNPDDVCALACGKIRYDSKIKDVLSTIGDIRTVPALLKHKKALCIDIVAFDVAVHRFEGRNAWPVVVPIGKNGMFHVLTELQTPEGVIQYDPSKEIEQLGRAYSGQPEQCNVCQ